MVLQIENIHHCLEDKVNKSTQEEEAINKNMDRKAKMTQRLNQGGSVSKQIGLSYRENRENHREDIVKVIIKEDVVGYGSPNLKAPSYTKYN